jgi:hypothetical protein
MKYNLNKKEVTTILVEKGNLALASGTLNTTGTAFNIVDGQIGVVSEDANGTIARNTFITAGTTSANVNAVRIVQGTPASEDLYNTDIFEIGAPALIKSDVIYKDSIRSFTALKFRVPRFAAFSPAGLVATSVVSNTTYKAYVTLDSVRNDRDFGDVTDVLPVTFTTKNVSTITAANRLDYLVNNIAYKANTYSRIMRTTAGNAVAGNRDIVTFAVSTAGGTGVTIGSITCGTVIPFIKDQNTLSTSTVTTSITATVPMVRAFAELIAKSATLTAASTIEVIDLKLAGTTSVVDTFITVGLNYKVAAYADDIEQSMTRVDVALGENWGLYTPTVIRQDEGTGQGTKWAIDADNRAQLQVHTMQKMPFMEYFSKGFTSLDPTKDYTSYILEYYDVENPLALTVTYPKKLVLLLPATAACITVAAGETNALALTPTIPSITGDSATISSLNAILGAWLESARPFSNFTVGGNATPATYFA